MTPYTRQAIEAAIAAFDHLLTTEDILRSLHLQARAGLAAALRESEREHFDAEPADYAAPFAEPAEEQVQRRAQPERYEDPFAEADQWDAVFAREATP